MNEKHLSYFSENAPEGTEDWFADNKTEEIPTYNMDSAQISQSSKKDRRKEFAWQSWQISIAIACIILGILVSLLFKTYKKEGEPYTIYNYGAGKNLAEMVKYLQTDRNKILADLSKTRQTLEMLEKSTAKGSGESTAIRHSLELARQEAGLTSVHGPGVIIQLSDSPRKLKDGDDPNLYIVHEVDLMALVNELWASGAEAVSINDQRIVMTTAIRCVGPTITVNTVRLAPPYVVKGIGPSSSLETGLKYPGGFLDNMAANIDRGVEIKITSEKDLKIAKFDGSLVNRYAKTYKGN